MAAGVACGLAPADVRECFMQAASRARVHPLGPIGRLAAILEGVLQGALGEDGHVRAREARLEVALIERRGGLDFRSMRVTEWESKQDLIECLVHGCHIPIVSGRAPIYRGQLELDGGFLGFNRPSPENPADVVIYHSPDQRLLDEGLRLAKQIIHPAKDFTWWESLFPPNAAGLMDVFRAGSKDGETWLRAHEACLEGRGAPAR